MMRLWRLHCMCLLAAMLMFAGCVANPVTGRKEIRLVTEAQELRIGQENDLISQQILMGATHKANMFSNSISKCLTIHHIST